MNKFITICLRLVSFDVGALPAVSVVKYLLINIQNLQAKEISFGTEGFLVLVFLGGLAACRQTERRAKKRLCAIFKQSHHLKTT